MTDLGLTAAANDFDRARCVSHDAFGHAAEDQAIESPLAVRADDDEIWLPVLRARADRVARVAIADGC